MTRRKFATMLMATHRHTRAAEMRRRARGGADPGDAIQEPVLHVLRDQNGFNVDVRPTNDLAEISRKAGIPEALEGCHTSFIAGYVVDGHVPVQTIRKLLAEKLAIAGITLPGMPSGSPGMYGEKTGPLTIYAISRDGTPPRIFAVD